MIALLDSITSPFLAAPKRNPLFEITAQDAEGNPTAFRYNFHPGQWRAWDSHKQIIAILAGFQSGKTSFLPHWLYREIYGGDDFAGRGAGDYLAVTATFKLFDKSFLPNMLEVFVDQLAVGKYWAGSQIIELMNPDTGEFTAKHSKDKMWGRIILASAQAGDLVSVTAKAAVLDEAGLSDYTIKTWDDAQARVSIHQGRICVGTTLYDLGWMKGEIYDPWAQARRNGQEHPDIDIIQFDSTENPAFPKEVFEKRKAEMPGWKFDMRYRGRYSRPAGAIYDCFDTEKHVVKPFPIPKDWPRYGGMDFGGVHTAAIYLAEDPKSAQTRDLRKLYVYREYMAGNRTATDHKQAIMRGEPPNIRWFGGSQSEDNYRLEYLKAGMRVSAPPKETREVEVGIDRTYKEIKRDRFYVFDTCRGVIQNLQDYSRELDDYNEPTDDIKDKKTFHYADGLRYVASSLKKARWEPVGYAKSPY